MATAMKAADLSRIKEAAVIIAKIQAATEIISYVPDEVGTTPITPELVEAATEYLIKQFHDNPS